MLVLQLLPEVHRPSQLGKKGGAKAELLPKLKLSADVFQQEILYFHILQGMCKTEVIVLICLFKEEMAFFGVQWYKLALIKFPDSVVVWVIFGLSQMFFICWVF